MTITLMISSGTAGTESAALDVALRLKIPYDGYTAASALLDRHPMARRYALREKTFDSLRDRDAANLAMADAALFFSRGELKGGSVPMEALALSQGKPCFHVDVNAMEPLQAAFHVRIWADKHSPERLYVTGDPEGDDTRIYQAVYDTLFSCLMLGRDTYPEQEQARPEKKPLPRSVEEAVAHLCEILTLKDKVTIANMSASEVGDLNQTLGNYIRNALGLWSGNAHLMRSCAEEAGRKALREGDASAIILGRLALELEKTHKLRKL